MISFIKLSKIILLIFSVFALLITLWVIWMKLPVTINRRSDIKLGNSVVEEIEKYRLKNRLPEDTDRITLRKFGFNQEEWFLKPDYHKINDSTYELIFLEGFDGPYLLWNSKEKVWKEGYPTFEK